MWIHIICKCFCQPSSFGGFVANGFSSPLLVTKRCCHTSLSFFKKNLQSEVPLRSKKTIPSWQQLDGMADIQQEVDGTTDISIDDVTIKPSLTKTNSQSIDESMNAFDKVVNARYACTRFQRYQEPSSDTVDSSVPLKASLSNPQVIQAAYKCLSLAQRAPTGFNAQPYRVVLVHDYKQKMLLSKYCLGRNADRIRDSDCTAVFLSDEQVDKNWVRFRDFLVGNMEENDHDRAKANTSRTRRLLSNEDLKKMRILILLFSNGYPLPSMLSRPFSFLIRLGVAFFASLSRKLYDLKRALSQRHSFISKCICKLLPSAPILPTLTSSQTWSQKNTMLVAMTYMLACTSRGLSTCPMEGFDAQGIRNVLDIPRRFGIPLIVSTGTQYRGKDEGVDDVGVSHGNGGMSSPRYPIEEVVFGNVFGNNMCINNEL